MQRMAGVFGGLGIVGDHHDGLAVLAVELLQQAEHVLGRLAIQIAGGLVADQQGGIGDDRAGDRHALLLTAGQLAGLVRGAVGQPHQLQRDGRVLLALRRRQLGQQQRQLDVALRREHRHQVVELKHETHVGCPPPRQRAAAELVDVLAAHADAAGAGHIQPADQVEQGGLAGAGRPHQRKEIAFGDIQVDVMQHLDLLLAALVGLGQIADLDQRAHDGSPVECWLWLGQERTLCAYAVDGWVKERSRTGCVPAKCRYGFSGWTSAPSRRLTGGAITTRSPGVTAAGSRRNSP